jgi:hypothetical protein
MNVVEMQHKQKIEICHFLANVTSLNDKQHVHALCSITLNQERVQTF